MRHFASGSVAYKPVEINSSSPPSRCSSVTWSGKNTDFCKAKKC